MSELLERYIKHGKLVSTVPSNISFFDESDRVFYDVAKTGNALLVTGNIKHYPKEPFIVPPLNFYRYILGRRK